MNSDFIQLDHANMCFLAEISLVFVSLCDLEPSIPGINYLSIAKFHDCDDKLNKF